MEIAQANCQRVEQGLGPLRSDTLHHPLATIPSCLCRGEVLILAGH